MFDRIISIDWSGKGRDEDPVGMRIADCQGLADAGRIQPPPNAARRRSWRRSECRTFLQNALSKDERTLVAMDFGFGLPWGSDQAIFGVKGWREMIRQIASLYAKVNKARKVAETINAFPQFNDHGPYRFNECRTDCRFYLDSGVAYYRLTELAAPQAMSQWYMGSGGTVAFSTITGLSAINHLIDLREKGRLKFAVWPMELVSPGQHVLVESYPAICPPCIESNQWQGNDERDAWKVLRYLRSANMAGDIESWFELPVLPFGRINNVACTDQIRFEGAIFGLR